MAALQKLFHFFQYAIPRGGSVHSVGTFHHGHQALFAKLFKFRIHRLSQTV